ncbi:hypothetical protein, variant [Aphanomyces astaci]|uniref:Uncharacterized protein n=1 Tax=Aphanomyces astaci TaxID=112090 RepID=W4HBP2_APHAT|nr:hypothetical protein, variant [Aphanomyces astaci]ETV89430.1 hypothetical protein, variant [Aphanomyces astaci]|eukprot:XP_009821830.1 hypothetical protein, variant [Aphanomyces astaci]
MPDITRDAELLKNLGRLVETIPSINHETGTSIAAFGDLEVIGAEEKPHVLFEFQEVADPSIPFYLQGSAQFQEADALEQRRQLKLSHNVGEAILQYWHVFPKLVVIDEHVITKQEYMQVMLLIFKVLRNDFERSTATVQIEKDWIIDSKSSQYMNTTTFFDALFEVVDVWTCDIQEATYIGFLNLLYRRISVRAIVFFDGTVIKVTLDDKTKTLHELMAEAVPLATLSAFSHIARYMGDSSITTMGDLAKAEPVDIERMRLAYIQKNDLSTEMFGSDLFQVLELMGRVASGEVNSLNSLVSLTRADPALIDCVRQAFISARHISTTEQTVMERILEELLKFGVNPQTLAGESMAKETYMNLFRLFVVKTGEEIADLAKRDLIRIKDQMERHGLYVPEDMLEAKYKEFFETVINTTGAEVVQGAKQWIMTHSNEGSLASLIQKEYDEFKPLDEAKAFTADDAEFTALTAEAPDDDDDDNDTNVVIPARKIPPKPAKAALAVLAPKPAPPSKLAPPPVVPLKADTPKPVAVVPEPPKQPVPSPVLKVVEDQSREKAESTREESDYDQQSVQVEVDNNSRKPSEMSTSETPVPFTVPVAEVTRAPTPEESRAVEQQNESWPSEAESMADNDTYETPMTPPRQDKAEEVRPPSPEKAPAPVQVDKSIVDEFLARAKPPALARDPSRKSTLVEYNVLPPPPRSPKEPKAKRKKSGHVDLLCRLCVPSIARYIHLLGFGEVLHAKTKEEAVDMCDPNLGPGVDLVCFVIGSRLEAAIPVLRVLMGLVGPRVILIGGDLNDPIKTSAKALESVAEGALYFATIPIDYMALRGKMQVVLENAPQKFIFRRKQEQPSSPLFKALAQSSDVKATKQTTEAKTSPTYSSSKPLDNSFKAPPALTPPVHGDPPTIMIKRPSKRSWFGARLPSLRDMLGGRLQSSKSSFMSLRVKMSSKEGADTPVVPPTPKPKSTSFQAIKRFTASFRE